MTVNSASFRDPSGFVFEEDGKIYRAVNKCYEADFRHLHESGLLSRLFEKEWLIKHVIEPGKVDFPDVLSVLRPDRIPTISYPYEWSFSQLKEAALLTLSISKLAMEYGMVLKDASAFNIQFVGYRPVMIDSLSFQKYEDGQPWYGYRQFCEHFLAPLVVCSQKGVKFLSLLRGTVDGVPLDLASDILPRKTWLYPSILFHIHLHARSIKKSTQHQNPARAIGPKIKKNSLVALIDHLINIISSLRLPSSDQTIWQDYDQETHYSPASKASKSEIVMKYVSRVDPRIVWDLGANDGFFSRVVAGSNRYVLATDGDYLALEKNFLEAKREGILNVLPLYFDVANPTPSIGWANQERLSLSSRSKPDLIMALALVHHLAISSNIPFSKIAQYLDSLTKWLVIEFVPSDDNKVKMLPNNAGKASYSRAAFDAGFAPFFDLIDEQKILDSNRSICLFRRRNV